MALIHNAEPVQYSGFLEHDEGRQAHQLKAAESQFHYDDDVIWIITQLLMLASFAGSRRQTDFGICLTHLKKESWLHCSEDLKEASQSDYFRQIFFPRKMKI